MGGGAALGGACDSTGCLAGTGWSCVLRALLSRPLGRRGLVRSSGGLVGGFGWDLEDLGDGLSQAEHHLVWVTTKVAGLEVPQGLVPKVVAAEVLPMVQWKICRQGSCLDHHLTQSALVKLDAVMVQMVGPLDIGAGHPQG